MGPSAALDRYEAYRRSLRDELGTDPARPQAVHQLLQGTAPVVRHGVAYEPNPLLGRDDDIAAVADLLRSVRITSIVGPGGLGKTRLAQVVSRARRSSRIVRFVPLAGVAPDGDVASEVAAALGAGEPDAPDRRAVPTGVVAGIAALLGPGPALLVLDNCEHRPARRRRPGARPGVDDQGPAGARHQPGHPAGLSSESVYLLPELSLPTSVELFGQRARAARPGVDLPADAVEEVCRHLDGLPLAVELSRRRGSG